MFIDNLLATLNIVKHYVKENPERKLYCVYNNEYQYPEFFDVFDEDNLRDFIECYLEIDTKRIKKVETLIKKIKENHYEVVKF